MAKKQHHRDRGAYHAADIESQSSEPPRRRRGRRSRVLGAALVLAAGAGAYATWHRQKDPNRIWAARISELHRTHLEARLTRCLGGADAAAVRRLVPEVRRGTLPASLRECRGPGMSELVVTPTEFSHRLSDAPEVASSARVRERDRLDRLGGSLTALQSRLSDVSPDTRTLPEDTRDSLATALEDVAVDVDAERTTLNELVAAAESGASYF